jgi:hypothetical protein
MWIGLNIGPAGEKEISSSCFVMSGVTAIINMMRRGFAGASTPKGM